MIDTGYHSTYGQGGIHTGYDRNNNNSHSHQQPPGPNGYVWNKSGNTPSATDANSYSHGFYGHSDQSHYTHDHGPFTSFNYNQAQDQNHLPLQLSQYQHKQINNESYGSGAVGVNNVNMNNHGHQQHNYNYYNNVNGYQDGALGDATSEKTIKQENMDPSPNEDVTYLLKWSSPSPRPSEYFYSYQ